MRLLYLLLGPPIGLDGTMKAGGPGPAHRARPQRSEGPKRGVILFRAEWPHGGQGKIIAREVVLAWASGHRCP